MDCLFCKIINKEVPSEIVYEDEKIVAIKDIKPKAPVHLLIILRKHLISVANLELEDKELVGEMIITAKKIAEEQNIAEQGYKLVFNVGRGGGQLIDHIHLHLLSGERIKIP